MSVDFRTVARAPLQYAPQANARPTMSKRQLVGQSHSFNDLKSFHMPLPTHDRATATAAWRTRRTRSRPQSVQPFSSPADQQVSSMRLSSGGSAAALAELPPRPSTAPAQRGRPSSAGGSSSGGCSRRRPSSGGLSRSGVQRPWLDQGLRAGEGGRLIFAKLELLEDATAQNILSERLSACSELFDAVIKVDTTYGAVLQRVKQEYDDAGVTPSGGPGGFSGTENGSSLSENYANLGEEYWSIKAQLEEQGLESKILSEQYEIVLRQQQRLAVQHEEDQQKLAEQQDHIDQLEQAADIASASAAQRRSMDLASVQISSTDHVRKLEQLVQELALELDAARGTEATALQELVSLRGLLAGSEDCMDAVELQVAAELDMVDREHSAAALQAERSARSNPSEATPDLDSPLLTGGPVSEVSMEDARSIASTMCSGSDMTVFMSGSPAHQLRGSLPDPVPLPLGVPSLDVSAASLASEMESLTADGQKLAAEREALAAAQNEVVAPTAAEVREQLSGQAEPELDAAAAGDDLTTAIAAVTSPLAFSDGMNDTSLAARTADLQAVPSPVHVPLDEDSDAAVEAALSSADEHLSQRGVEG